MSANRDNVKELLDEIEAELKKLNLWGGENNRPYDECFLSIIPFFMDKMDFHQWLEYVLLPKMREILDSGFDLPGNLLVHTYAQEYYRHKLDAHAHLVRLLRALDLSCNPKLKV